MTSLRHLRSSTANKRPDPTAMVDGQLAMNYDIASPGLFFKDDNGTLVKVGPVHVGTTAPNVSPAAGGTAGNSIGEQWLDTTSGVYVLKVWDGSEWRSESGTFVDVSGDTMTGALTMANQQAVRFSETTANGSNYIALQATAAIASNKTITLPDTTGTIVTTGDTGTVTSTMIENGTILNADVNASAAIAGTKVSPDFGSQTIATSGIFSSAAGTAAAPSIAFTGDLNTGIYSPGADQLAVSTGGTGRLFVDSSGRVGIGTSSPAAALEIANIHGVNNTITRPFIIRNYGQPSATGYGVGMSFYYPNGSNTGFEAASIDSSYTAGGNNGNLIFSTNNNAGVTERLRIDSSGRVGIGTSSPGYALHVVGAGAANEIRSDSGTITGQWYQDVNGYGIFGTASNHPQVFRTNATERMRIASNGLFTMGGLYVFTTAGAANVNVDSSGVVQRSTSSIKYKTNIETLENSYSEALLECRPVWYKSTCKLDNPGWGWWGFIAEEVAEIDPRLVHWKTTEITYDDKGSAVTTPCDPEPEGVAYDRFVPHLLNLIKQQKEQAAAMQARIETLEAAVAALQSA